MRIFPLGENALIVEFGTEVSLELNRKSLNLAAYFQKNPFPGLVEAVPAYASTSVFYDPIIVRNTLEGFGSAFEAVKDLCEKADSNFEVARGEKQIVEIPINIDSSALDLDVLCEFSGLSPSEVTSIFLERIYTVFMIGFLPGFAYMGEVDERIAAPRRETPRKRVPKGSVGIAEKQTGIYPLETPGGWQIIGRTETQVFDPLNEHPCLLEAGHEVKFVRV